MTLPRVFKSADFFQPAEGEPVRSVVTESAAAVVVAWYLQPGQEILPHLHPYGQDTWTVLSGTGDYYLDAAETTTPIGSGDIVVAPTGCVHGVINRGQVPLILISVVAPANAGYHLVTTARTSATPASAPPSAVSAASAATGELA